MRLFRSAQSAQQVLTDVAATIGNFDGVHHGHRALLSKLRQEAKRRHLPVLVVLFEPQPAEYFAKKNAPARLSNLREKIELLRAEEVDYVVCVKFNQKTATTSAEAFADQTLFSMLRIRYMLVGEDFRFGYQRLGNVELLRKQALKRDADIELFPDFSRDSTRISSTCIRQALAQADFKAARDALGYPYFLCGRVIHGNKLGREWGIPTANISWKHTRPPLQGVFCVQVQCQGESIKRPAVANLGYRPSIEGVRFCFEVHLLLFDGDLYGQRLKVFFRHKLRDEVKFPSTKALIQQIQDDIEKATRFFQTEIVA